MARSRTCRHAVTARLTIVLAVLSLGACGTFSGRSGGDARTADSQSPSRGTDGARKRGGYYLDDGPADRIPIDLDAVPDATPRLEPLHRGAARPYSVLGRSYTPMVDLAAYRARGVATWYGRRYHGQRTSSGEIYDMFAMTAAHTTLPIPSYARVTNIENGRSVVVRINDRGPFVESRLIDLSYVAAHRIGLLRAGSGLVEVESILPSGAVAAARAPRSARASSAGDPGDTVNAPMLAVARASAATDPDASSDAPAEVRGPGHYLQLGAFSVQDNAQRFMERMQVQLSSLSSALSMTASNNLFRIQVGPYATRAQALQAAERIGQILGSPPVVASSR